MEVVVPVLSTAFGRVCLGLFCSSGLAAECLGSNCGWSVGATHAIMLLSVMLADL